MIGKNIEVTSLEALFLMTLYNSSSLSGTEIVQKIRNDLGENWTPTTGATYKIVQSLTEKGYIKETTLDARKDKRIRTYALTVKGKEMVSEVTMRVQKLLGFLADCCPDVCEGVVMIVRKDKDSDLSMIGFRQEDGSQ
ncbi:MAG: PadR family transcriptional regulator [Candidatus Heimdallarchaeota archaeon]